MKRPKPRSGQEQKPQPQPPSTDGNQGEGNREADRRYRDKATRFARSPELPKAVREAREGSDRK